VLHGVGPVGGQRLATLYSLAVKNLSPMQIMRNLNKRFGRHAAHSGTGRSQFATVDEHKRFFGPTNLRHSAETGCSGAQDGNINLTIHR